MRHEERSDRTSSRWPGSQSITRRSVREPSPVPVTPRGSAATASDALTPSPPGVVTQQQDVLNAPVSGLMGLGFQSLASSRAGLPAEGAPEVMGADAIKFASMKVSSISGDARRVLDISRRTVELVHARRRAARIEDVKEVIKEDGIIRLGPGGTRELRGVALIDDTATHDDKRQAASNRQSIPRDRT